MGNLCQCSVNLTVKKCFLMFRKSPEFQFVTIASGAITAPQKWESLHPLPVTCPSFLYILIRSLQNLPFSRLKSSSSLSLSSYVGCPSPLIILVGLHWTLSRMSMSVLYWETQNRTQYFWDGLTALNKGEGCLAYIPCGVLQVIFSQATFCWLAQSTFGYLAGSSLGAGLPSSLCWSSWGSWQPSSPVCHAPDGSMTLWWISLSSQSGIWKCTLPHHPDH